jgi:hypothetical protein
VKYASGFRNVETPMLRSPPSMCILARALGAVSCERENSKNTPCKGTALVLMLELDECHNLLCR